MKHSKPPRKLRISRGLQQLLYYRKSPFLKSVFYDPFEGWKNGRSRRAMRLATRRLDPLSDSPGPQVHLLSGNEYWYQTCFCVYSMGLHSGRPIVPVIYSDGSLEEDQYREFQRLFPNALFKRLYEIEQRLDSALPFGRFPTLRTLRIHYPHLRKVTDVHAGGSGWKLVLDSDMLFFRKPEFLLDWLDDPGKPCHLADVKTTYGYSSSVLRTLASEIPERVNVGVCGLKSEHIDWGDLERWSRALIEAERPRYTHEQALVALLLAGKRRAVAPAGDYIVCPTKAECCKPTAVLHHYVAGSKSWYYRSSWKALVG